MISIPVFLLLSLNILTDAHSLERDISLYRDCDCKNRENGFKEFGIPSDNSSIAGIHIDLSYQHPIVADHSVVEEFEKISYDELHAAVALRVLVRHASVGEGINWGLDCLAGNHPTNPACVEFDNSPYDRSNWDFQNRGNPGWKAKVDDLVDQTAEYLDVFDVLTMKFCYIDALYDNSPDFNYYCDAMEQLEANYSNKCFVWWTIPLTRDGQPGTDRFNAQVRDYTAMHDKILFDIADIECYDSDGTKQTNGVGNEVICEEYTNEEHAGHLNVSGRKRVAKAFWWLMTEIAAYTGISEESAQFPEEIVFTLSPNPFRTSSEIRLYLPVPGSVSARIFDILGREVKTLVDTYKNTGSHIISLHAGKEMAWGVYFCELRYNNGSITQKVLIYE